MPVRHHRNPHIIPALGKQPLDLISNRAIAELLSTMQTKGYAPGTTNRVLVLLRFIFNLARKWGEYHLPENPTLGLKTAPDVSRSRFLSHEEARRLIAALEADENVTAAKAIRLLLLTGARRNEITHAKWAHVDWTNGTLLVPRSKSGKPRHIVLNSAAIGLLKSIPAVSENDFIFPSPATGRPSPSLHFPWKRIRQVAQLEGVRLHDLRHSFASFLVNEGVSLYVVQKLLGHTHAHTTQRYAHLARATLNEAAEVVGRQLDRCRASVELA
jgi:integrase